MIVNSSSISNQNDEFDFFKKIIQSTTLAKNTSGSFFAERVSTTFSTMAHRSNNNQNERTKPGSGWIEVEEIQIQVQFF